jgi:2-methylisocitrate lyase-like PEP mutase family enzyme
MQRAMRAFERAGASALQVEDQSYPKRCGHLQEKRLIPAPEMVGKIRAAADARASEETLIVARTDAISVEGLDAALDRARMYGEAGADALFLEAPGNLDQLAAVPTALGGWLPLMANMVEGGRTPIRTAAELEAMGYSLVIFPGGVVRAMALAAQEFYGTLLRDGTSDAFRNRMFDFDNLNAVIGTPEMLALGKRYEGDRE